MNDMQSKWDKWSSERSGKGGGKLDIQVIALLLVTCYFTVTYLFRAINNWIVAAAGVFAFDVGALIWSDLHDHDASNRTQLELSDWMFKLDAAGMFLTTIASLVPHESMPPIIYELTNWIVPIVFFVNVIAGILYKRYSDKTKLEMTERDAKAELNYQEARSTQELEQRKALVAAEKKRLEHEQEVLAQEQQNILLGMQLDAARRGGKIAQGRGTHVDEAADDFGKRVVGDFKKLFGQQTGEVESVKAFGIKPIIPATTEPSLDDEMKERIARQYAEIMAAKSNNGNGNSPNP